MSIPRFCVRYRANVDGLGTLLRVGLGDMAPRCAPRSAHLEHRLIAAPRDADMRARLRHRRELLAAAFEVDIADVIADSRMVRCWSGPWDDALVAICRAHAWDAEMGVLYLAHLKHAYDPDAGPLPSAWLSY